MMRSHGVIGRVIGLYLLAPLAAHGAGFEIAEHGAAATGMVGAFTAKADDVSTIFYNAAGLAYLSGLQAYVGTTLVVGGPDATGAGAIGTTDGDVKFAPLPTIYLSYGFSHHVSIGVGLFTNYGLKVGWPQDWPGRFLITEDSLNTVTVNPTVAWSPVSWFSIGAGLDVTPASLELARQFDLGAGAGEARFRGNAVGVGANVGVLFRAPRLGRMVPFSVGVQYRSRYDLNFNDGVLDLTVPQELSQALPDVRASTSLPIPDVVSTGVGVHATDRLFFQAQFDWTNWSRFQSLQLRTDNPAFNSTTQAQWHDGYTLRGGAEYALDRVRMRLGFGFDWTPIPSRTLGPFLPDADRFLVSGGVQVNLPRRLVVEGSVMGVIFRPRQSELPEFPAHYTNFGILTGLSFSYRSGT
jgi:long-chain fatty acid transport protein